MKSIEERAKSFANERWPKEKFKSNDRYRREHYQKSRDTYIAIATEQRAIDIDKAKKAVCQYICPCKTKCKEPNMNCEHIILITQTLEE